MRLPPRRQPRRLRSRLDRRNGAVRVLFAKKSYMQKPRDVCVFLHVLPKHVRSKLDLIRHVLHTSTLKGPCLRAPCEKGKLLASVVAALHALVSLGLIFLILLHAGRGGGLSDMFGGGMSSGFSGSNVVERNLDRITVGAAVLFSMTTVALVWLWR